MIKKEAFSNKTEFTQPEIMTTRQEMEELGIRFRKDQLLGQ